jgi:hypothetical protein
MIRRASKFILFAGALVGGGLLAASRPETIRGSGNPVSEDRAVGPVDEVIVSGAGNLTIASGDLPALTVTADDNLLPLIETETSGRQLHITTRSGYRLRPTAPLTYTLTVPSLAKLTVSGAVAVKVERLAGESLAVRLSGVADASFLDIGYRDLSLTLSGSGHASLSGAATKTTVRVSGSGDVDASGLRSLTGEAQVSGSGKVRVWATQSLNARVSGSGEVRYRGEPRLEKKVSGSGKVKPIG